MGRNARATEEEETSSNVTRRIGLKDALRVERVKWLHRAGSNTVPLIPPTPIIPKAVAVSEVRNLDDPQQRNDTKIHNVNSVEVGV